MTPEQVTKQRSWMFAMFGAGIACFITAYQYAQPVTGRAEPPPEFAPYLFAGIGIACMIVGGLLALKLRNQTVPAVTVDFTTPEGKKARLIAIAGFVALGLSVLIDFFAPADDILWLAISVILLAAMVVCFVISNRIVRSAKAASSGANKK